MRHPLVSSLTLTAIMLTACGPKARPALPPPEVAVMTVTPQTITASYQFVGQAEASKRVEVRSQLNGVIIERPYTEGTDVPKGELLFRIDPTTYEAVYRSSQARLDNSQARLDNATRNLNRLRPLLTEHAVSQKDVDDAETEYASSKADVADAKAALDKAKKDYDDTWVRAEIPGRVGRAQLVLGARVTGPGDLLTTIDQINPIYVDFSPSDQQLLRWRNDLASKKIVVPSGKQEVEVTLADGSVFLHKGQINFADITIQPGTGTLQLRAEFANPQRILLPGQFVRVSLLGVKRNGAILVPQRAVLQGQGGAFVYVVDSSGTATARDIKTSSSQGDDWIVESGLAAGERVIVDGVQKVVSGKPVKIGEAPATTSPSEAAPAKSGAN
ncbi:MAG TPA: efflux RND transporter periplasmic adaptor subunit [Gemmatimonadales bacterium]|nr:efflux RND transporter periplasmic adaptor subunit [Gemmatimonadales bacterium]